MTSEPVISQRGLTLIEERARIGRGAASLIGKGQIVMIDGGSTTFEAARCLSQLNRDLIIITNSTGVASVAGANPTFRVIVCPGTYDSREGSVFGEDTVEFVRRYNADVAIIGASGVTVDGPNDMISGAAAIKRAMMSRSLSTVLVVSSEKFGRSSLNRVCALSEISDIVTDCEPQVEWRVVIEEAGTELHVFAGN
ncbi:DeoR/GlpR family DNA-binding transcription regulator [Mesorhizobium sp. STM 4661]|uniref:DeoR/GlpR family DNA-binding transcription regulator n=1 Tax=Mesorhizobium sp. STM 4661 TaxID=1297570 RepID=UPI0002BFEBF2